ncbi:sensor histidine kinase [Nakamurella endophytica]|uniref:sensor histidine kinase n=1 Tax=Nakamurella endophytica TaxID=1748367 RepID=UPI001E373070|nr:sensor histidine kinase [Nakamurella endophytica]
MRVPDPVVTAAAVPRPGGVRAAAFLLLSLPLRIAGFVLLLTGTVVGVATTVVWVGIPVLVATTAATLALARTERRWVRRLLGTPLAEPAPEPPAAGVLRRWRDRVTDPATWRAAAYVLVGFPLGVVEFVLAALGVVLVPIAVWVLPWVAWLHSHLALALLGPSRADRMQRRAERLQTARARGVEAAEAERRRIERDLHDGAQQRLVAVAVNLGRARAKFDTDPAAARGLVGEAHTDAKLAVAELRDLARGIFPAVLADRGLDAALSSLAARSPVPVHVDVALDPRPPAAVDTTAYFIVGEALTNVAKHSGALSAQVRVWRTDDRVVVEVTDDGHGGAAVRPGGGLAGLADRAATIDGALTVVSPSGGPTVVRADLPCTW